MPAARASGVDVVFIYNHFAQSVFGLVVREESSYQTPRSQGPGHRRRHRRRRRGGLYPGLHPYVTPVGERIVRASNSPYPDWQLVVFESA